ncbi:MAG: hypothetical protein MR899_07520 [Clostridium sp.]|nr:hypothetical protein [Clostridium sp.]MDY5755268.1 hypothetical protein [Eubacteriales bacterium]
MGGFIFFFIMAVIIVVITSIVKGVRSFGTQYISDADNDQAAMEAELLRKRQAQSGEAAYAAAKDQSTFRPAQQSQSSISFRTAQQPQSSGSFRTAQQTQSSDSFRPAQQTQSSGSFRPARPTQAPSASQQRFDPFFQGSDGKPRVTHSTEDCTGGSIHDGYHEGTPGKQGKYNPPSAGRAMPEGVQLPGEDHSIHFAPVKEADKAPAASGADKLIATLAGKPSIVQGVIWGEILGKPRSEIE